MAWPNGSWGVVMWKTNPRWDDDQEMLKTHPQPYFGDPDEFDDYDMAMPENAPSMYLPFDEPEATQGGKI